MTLFLYLYFPTIYVHDIIISINDSFIYVTLYQHVNNVEISSSKRKYLNANIYVTVKMMGFILQYKAQFIPFGKLAVMYMCVRGSDCAFISTNFGTVTTV